MTFADDRGEFPITDAFFLGDDFRALVNSFDI